MEIEIGEALEREDLFFIDLRSPGEFTEASIPGAVNFPLFDDREHHQLGLVYRHMGETEARRTALAMVAPRLPELTTRIINACAGKTALLYCRRGGLRSYSLYQVLTLSGIPVLRLKHGYKAFRLYINAQLSEYKLKSKLYVLHGLTGVGKTSLLKILASCGTAIIDLEELAGHRGSVFGAVGIDRQRSQKDFDALLFRELEEHKNEKAVVIEGEGRRIGNIFLPSFLSQAMVEGFQILLTAPLERRVERIVKIYAPQKMAVETLAGIREALQALRHRMGCKKADRLLELLEEGNYNAVAEGLCSDYYDLYYSDSKVETASFDLVLDATDLESAAGEVMALLERNKRQAERKPVPDES